MRINVYNHVRPIGRFRATAPARDHGDNCHCGGSCDACGDKSRLGQRDRFQRDSYEKVSLAIDVVYARGGYGRPKSTETRHYVVPGIIRDSRGYPPEGLFVRSKLHELPEHKAMRKEGWSVEKMEGYYK